MRSALPLVLAACSASSTLPPARFANAPPVDAVNDRRDVPTKPEERAFARVLWNIDGQFLRLLTRALELPRERRALGVNALDEVPDSTWFTNRIGVRDMSPEEIAAAPRGVGSPEPHKPWTVVSTKEGGATPGFIIKDARGEKFLMKFDVQGQPEGETATQIIMGKLMWGFGLNVTEDYVAHVRPDELVLAPDAAVKDTFGNKRPLTREELDRRLASVDHMVNGHLRVLVSHWLPGKPLGGHSSEGVREDDPNDRIPHELRRDLRGLYALFSWLDHIDIHGGNMLDVYVEDPADRSRHYVKHYWVDYGIGLGYGARKNSERRYGYEFYVDYPEMLRSFLSFGAFARAWEEREPQTRRGVGMYESRLYDPGAWKSSSPAYLPIYVADRIDKFWASKIIIRFKREHIQAAVDAAKLTDKDAARWLVDTLIARQRATAKYWFERVNPLDRFAASETELCFDDLSITHAFTPAAGTMYTLTYFTTAGKQLAARQTSAGASGVTCSPLVVTKGGDGYTIVRIETARPAFRGTTYVHLAREPATGAPRVIGIWRP